MTSIHASQDDRVNRNWLEIGLPGAHSDVGGSYNNEYSRIPLSMGYQYLQRLGAPMKPLGNYAPPSLDDPDLKLYDSRYLPYSSTRAVHPATPLPTLDPDWKGSPRGL